MMTVPSAQGEMKESCFSAVMPVIGWNQWVKWVAPFSMAQSFMALATTPATCGSSAVPCRTVCLSDLYTSLGSRSFITASLKTMLPNSSGTFFIVISPICADARRCFGERPFCLSAPLNVRQYSAFFPVRQSF